MADVKITSLAVLTAADPINDAIPIVDVSDNSMVASGTTKRISINNILACSPSATLASATITGDLTAARLIVTGGTIPTNGLWLPTTNTLEFAANSLAQYRIAPLGVFSWYDGAGGTRMTLNANGLGVGIVPGSGVAPVLLGVGVSKTAGTSAGYQIYQGSTEVVRFATDNASIYIQGITNLPMRFYTNNVNNMTLDASGNLLVGTTSPLASGSTFQNLGINRQVLTLKGDTAVSYTSGIWNASTTGDALFQYFATETTLTVRGGISYNRAGGLVAYNTTSDYRAKDIIGPVSNSGSLIDSLKVYVGKMKGATIERPMLIAHEVQEVAPYAVTGTKDEVDADGNPKYQQMDVSALVPVLIAEIQSLRARVQTLEAK